MQWNIIQMSTNQTKLNTGFKQLSVLIVLLIVSPITLNISYKALQKYPYETMWIAYTVLGIGIILIIGTIILAFTTFKTLLDALFNKQ